MSSSTALSASEPPTPIVGFSIYKKTRILLDAGREPDEEEVRLPEIYGLFDRSALDAVFISHYHGDHIGLWSGYRKQPEMDAFLRACEETDLRVVELHTSATRCGDYTQADHPRASWRGHPGAYGKRRMVSGN